jgi:hypothetical protein
MPREAPSHAPPGGLARLRDRIPQGRIRLLPRIDAIELGEVVDTDGGTHDSNNVGEGSLDSPEVKATDQQQGQRDGE